MIIRGGANPDRPVYKQMVNAIEEFFPESGILDDEGLVVEEQPARLQPSSGHSRASSEGRPPFRHGDTETGVSSIVGSRNGDRPGGFVLVIDGTALGYVSSPLNTS